jgi:hypothetical protein
MPKQFGILGVRSRQLCVGVVGVIGGSTGAHRSATHLADGLAGHYQKMRWRLRRNVPQGDALCTSSSQRGSNAQCAGDVCLGICVRSHAQATLCASQLAFVNRDGGQLLAENASKDVAGIVRFGCS